MFFEVSGASCAESVLKMTGCHFFLFITAVAFVILNHLRLTLPPRVYIMKPDVQNSALNAAPRSAPRPAAGLFLSQQTDLSTQQPTRTLRPLGKAWRAISAMQFKPTPPVFPTQSTCNGIDARAATVMLAPENTRMQPKIPLCVQESLNQLVDDAGFEVLDVWDEEVDISIRETELRADDRIVVLGDAMQEKFGVRTAAARQVVDWLEFAITALTYGSRNQTVAISCNCSSRCHK